MAKARIKKTPTKVFKELKRLDKSFKGVNNVKVGFPKDSNDYPDGTSVVLVAIVHEFGSILRNIPERSFLRSTMKEKKREYRTFMAKLAKAVINETLTQKQALGLLGEKVKGDVQAKIIDLKEPPLKYREGNPLNDTGHMRQSVTYVVGKD